MFYFKTFTKCTRYTVSQEQKRNWKLRTFTFRKAVEGKIMRLYVSVNRLRIFRALQLSIVKKT